MECWHFGGTTRVRCGLSDLTPSTNNFAPSGVTRMPTMTFCGSTYADAAGSVVEGGLVGDT